MDITYFISAFVGLLAGVLSGLFGIGGGIVMVPMLVAVFGWPLLEANAASLAAMLLPVGVLGCWAYYKAGYVNLRNSLWISLGLFIGSFGGAELAMAMNDNVSLLSKLYAVFLFYVAMEYLDVPARVFGKSTAEGEGQNVERAFWKFLLLGAAAGVVAGLFGKGGGVVIVPVLVKIFKYNSKAAAATSLVALQLPVGLPSVLVYYDGGYLHILYAAIMAAGIVFGAFFGSKLAIGLPSKYFKKVYAVFLIAVAVYMALRTY